MTDPTCASGVELLADYLEGALPDDVRARILEWLVAELSAAELSTDRA